MKTWSQTYPQVPGRGVHINQYNGPVQILGGSGSDVKITASCTADVDLAEYIQVEQTENGLHLTVKSRRFAWSSSAIRLDIEVPAGTTCNVESGSGSVEILSTGAPVRIETGSGAVKVSDVGHARIETGSGVVQGRNISGSVSAESGSGGAEFTDVAGSLSIEVGSGTVSARQIQGDLRVETGSGQLLVDGVVGRVELETGSGGVNIRRVQGASLNVESGGGAMVLKEIDVAQLHVDASSGGADVELLQIYPGGSYEIETGSGGVQVAIPANADVKVRAEASSGRIVRSGLDFRVVHENAGELEAVLNGGLAELTVEAGSGGIRLVTCAATIQPPAAVRVVAAVKDDPALESSDQLRRIVAMVEEGKLSPQEAEELLKALDEEEPA